MTNSCFPMRFVFSLKFLLAALIASMLGALIGVAVFAMGVGGKPVSSTAPAVRASTTGLTAATFLGDVRTSISVISASDECLVLKNAEGADVRYVYNDASGTLTRVKAGSPALSLSGLRSFKLSLLDGRQNPASSASSARIVSLDWSDAGFGQKVIARLRG